MYGVRYGSEFILLHVDMQPSQHHLWKKLCFPHWMFLHPHLKQFDYRWIGLLLFLNWSIVDLQSCVSFRCTTKWFNYTYTHLSFFRFFSITGNYKILNIIPCAIGPCLPILYIVVCVPQSQSPNLPASPKFLLKLILVVCVF